MVDKRSETLARLEKFINWIDTNNIKAQYTDKPIYLNEKLLANSGWWVISLDPKILYRATQLFDDLMVYCEKEEITKFINKITNEEIIEK